MTTDPITGATTATTTAATTAQAANTISSDFQTFLEMLTVQMENQDPLNPIESSDYAVQLATFSSVEQQVQTNELLTALGQQLTTSGMADVATWVGREARTDAPAYFDGAPITIVPKIDALADDAELVVRNAAGDEVQRLALPLTSEPIDWAGVSNLGSPLPNGLYSFEVVSFANGDAIGAAAAENYGTVREVRNDAGAISVIFDGGVSVAADNVTALREADS